MGGDAATPALGHGAVGWCQWPLPRRAILAVLGHLMWAVCYADRTNISLAIVPMAEEKGWSSDLQGRVLSSFFFGYVTTQVLGGWLSLRYGGKPVLATAVALWSTSTLLTPLAADASFGVLLFCRVTMGIGEGMALPCLHHLTARWIPLTERSIFLSSTAVGKFVGTGAAMAAAPLVAKWWPSIFYLFGILGLLWVVAWQLMASSEPRSCKHISAAEKTYLLAAIEDFGSMPGPGGGDGGGGGDSADGEAGSGQEAEKVSLLRQRRPAGEELSRASIAELSASDETAGIEHSASGVSAAADTKESGEQEVAAAGGGGAMAVQDVDVDGIDAKKRHLPPFIHWKISTGFYQDTLRTAVGKRRRLTRKPFWIYKKQDWSRLMMLGEGRRGALRTYHRPGA